MNSATKHSSGLALALLLCGVSSSALANNYLAPFSLKNQNPFIQIYGLPATEPAELVEQSNSAAIVALDMANSSMLDTVGNEDIILDGETYRLSLTFRHGLRENIEVGVELPFIAHSNGFMDNFIEGWHDAFGLTNTEREKTTSNTLNYNYSRNGTPIFGFTNPSEGIGDIRFFAAKQLYKEDNSALALHASIKLPSGDADRLHGSGGSDVSLSLAHLKHRWLTRWAMSTSLNGGVLLMSDSDRFEDMQKSAVAFGSAAIIWDSKSLIDLKAQLDVHTKFYDSAIDQLGTNTVQFTIGGSVHINPTSRFDIGVGENLMTDTTPDFLINLAYKKDL